ncbi:GNAT family N-acetyltransferase [Paenibacillus sp. S33]|uniref:GNAT family N-acetyltransferase n=2 Tax=Paenibacillus TaxID=44249 RepID=UPI002AB5D9FD|nr:GNAT family N-acetyltransferase [Paenibacillus polymyxa]MDY7990853.1 GNAT family N-acetyltransferase [Paenibacillus polymyxa]MDY8117334.1 GNAT family N-acetyltransferase [Paenibacillus polymyxa]
MVLIRNIQPADAEAYWNLRLEALQMNPEAFGTSYEEAALVPLSDVVKQIQNKRDHYILGAFTKDHQLVGMTGFRREQKIKTQHKGAIWGVYVPSTYRGQGIAKKLLFEVISQGRKVEGLKQINLSVVTTNQAAVELYRKLGFETYGIEKNALEYHGQGYDEEFMAYFY